jgi:2-oxo-4-hydroxy-4-carboxy-5-ureidoimidazoline decarboxylase
MTLSEFNHIPRKEAFNAPFSCCGSTSWANQLVSKRAVKTIEDLKSLSNFYWSKTEERDWLEAFSHHPKTGDLNALEKKFAATAGWASNEQSSVNKADITVLKNLSQGNDAY